MVVGSRFHLNRALRLTYDELADRLEFGSLPPAAFNVIDPPPFLRDLLSYFSSPRSLGEAKKAFSGRATEPELAEVLEDLVHLGVIVPESSRGRFDRHELYFGLLGMKREDYASLASTRIGIIGTGGIGSTAALMLAAAGVGHLVISDGDYVEESNLTRSILFREGDVGKKKVLAAKRSLQRSNSSTSVRAVFRAFDGPHMVSEVFADCDLVLLSADSPTDVHRWVNQGCLALGIPYITAGYIEVFGSVGPLVVPRSTACYECGALYGIEARAIRPNLNASFQAPSYGPLNSIVASIAVNEIIRFSLGLEAITAGTQMLIDSRDYEIHAFPVHPHERCHCGAFRGLRSNPQSEGKPISEAVTDRFEALVDEYKRERATESLSHLLLDDLLLAKCHDDAALHILDLGCATGELSRQLARQGHEVTAVDSSPAMTKTFRDALSREERARINVICADAIALDIQGPFDRILLNLILDHLADPSLLLSKCRSWLGARGRMIVTVPHPFKDSGHWRKVYSSRGWVYRDFVVNDYFFEGTVTKSREDAEGNVTVGAFTSHKRTLSAYFDLLIRGGFSVVSFEEPSATPNLGRVNANYEKASRMPYFAVFECVKGAS